MEELTSRLAQLEAGYYGDKEADRQRRFFDRYGERFSNNQSLGMAILNELDARGVDTSAADEAVQQIIDQLNEDCEQIKSMLKATQRQLSQAEDKISAVADVVDERVAGNPLSATGVVQEAPPPEAVPEGAAAGPTAEPTGEPPEGGQPEAEPPRQEEAQGGEPGQEEAAGGGGEGPGEGPQTTGDLMEMLAESDKGRGEEVSSATMKNIKARLGKLRERRASAWRPSAEIISAVKGGPGC